MENDEYLNKITKSIEEMLEYYEIDDISIVPLKLLIEVAIKDDISLLENYINSIIYPFGSNKFPMKCNSNDLPSFNKNSSHRSYRNY